MAPPDKLKYGKLNFLQILSLVAVLVPLPAVLLWKVVTRSFAPYNKHRSIKRIIGDAAMLYIGSSLSASQLQFLTGTTLGMYEQWTKTNNLPKTVDELGEDARLLWIGPKRTGRVVLFMHGGAFFCPASDHTLSFWRYAQLELDKRNIEVGFALLNYSLAPDAIFPTPLKQASLAIDFLIKAGVQPQNLQLAGDSAGGNLVIQVLSHMLHPLAGVPEIHLPAPLRGALLISPWTDLLATSASWAQNDGRDVTTPRVLGTMGAQILRNVPAEHFDYVEAGRAPEDWFARVQRCVERVLITAGGAECMHDDIVAFKEVFTKHHSETKMLVQKDGLHEDMFLDFFAGEQKLGSLTPLAIEWLEAGFSRPAA